LPFYGKLGRIRPVSQAYYESEKLFFGGDLAFGFPCNDFSVVGEQKGINGVYRPLYTCGLKALRILDLNVS